MESDYFTTQEQVTRQQHYNEAHNTSQSEHFGVILFTYLFKLWAFFFYMFASWISSNIIMMFVVIIILLSCDFWVVKNVSGRKLVGLRWWNNIDENGVSHWYFESREGTNNINNVDWLAFWLQLQAAPVVWFVVGLIFAGLSFQWLMLVLFATVMSSINLIGYQKCKINAGKELRKYLATQATKMLTNDSTMVSNAV